MTDDDPASSAPTRPSLAPNTPEPDTTAPNTPAPNTPVPSTPVPSAPEPNALDVVPPVRIAALVEQVGVRKSELPALQTLVLAVLAGAFIAFGGMAYTVAVTGSEWGYGPTRLLGGLAFSMGLILVVIGGAELFTGNNLIVMAWAERKVSLAGLLRNWSIVFTGNLIGALGCVFLVHLSGVMGASEGQVAATARAIADAKAVLPPVEAFFRGILCNTLVCLAVWMCFAAHTVAGKVLAIIFPITAFVALGFEHSVANMYLMPIGALQPGSMVTLADMATNILIVTAGNIVGGSVFVALVYWLIYLRRA